MHNISVLIPAYNSENTIKRCIDSVLNQTYKNITIIVVNDGSTDNTLNILKEYKSVKVYNRKKSTIGDVRNILISKCKSKYFIFLDSDDYLEKDCLKTLYDEILCGDFDIVMGNTHNKLNKKIIIDSSNKYDYLFNNEIPYFITVWNKLYKRELFDNIKFPSYSLAEDEFVAHHILNNVNKMVVLPNKTYNYVVSPNGMSKSVLQNYREAFSSFYDRLLFFQNTKYEKLMYKKLSNYIIDVYRLFKSNHLDCNDIVSYFKKIYSCKFFSFKYFIFKHFPNLLFIIKFLR